MKREKVCHSSRQDLTEPSDQRQGLLMVCIPAIRKVSAIYAELITISQECCPRTKSPKLDNFNSLNCKLSAKSFLPIMMNGVPKPVCEQMPDKHDLAQTLGIALQKAGVENVTNRQIGVIANFFRGTDNPVDEVDSTVEIPTTSSSLQMQSPNRSDVDMLNNSCHPLLMQLRETLNVVGMDCKWTKTADNDCPNLLLTQRK